MATAVADTYSAASGAVLYGGRSSAVPAYVTNAVARRWFKSGNGLTAIDPKDDPTINPVYPDAPPWRGTNNTIAGIFAYSGGGANPDAPTFYQWGGGHGDSGNNGVYALDLHLSTPTWRHERKPAGSIGNWDGITEYVWDGLDSSQDTYNNGEPRSAHTYNGVCVAGGKIYVTQGYKAGLGGVNGQTLFAYNLTTHAWETAATLPGGGAISRDMCYDSLRNRLCLIGGGNGAITFWNITTGAWTQTSSETSTSQGARMIYIPEIDAIVGLNHNIAGANAFFAHDFGRTGLTGGVKEYQPATSGTNPLLANRGEWAASTAYSIGDRVFPAVTMTDWSAKILRCTAAGTNGSNNALTVPAIGATLTDGGVTWTVDPHPDLRNGVWVPSLGAIVGWSWGANLWTLTPPASGLISGTWTWGVINADGGNTVTPVGRPGAQDPETFGRLFHWSVGGIDMIGLSLLEESGNAAIQPYFFKL